MMKTERAPRLAPRMQAAVEELKGLVQERYPDATFQVTRSPEDRKTVLLKPVVDLDDRDEVMDVVIDRLIELQSEEQLPLLVVPVRPQARSEAIRQRMKQTAPAWRTQLPPIQP
jgi:hypothetical protein